jgi:hypothetical protein
VGTKVKGRYKEKRVVSCKKVIIFPALFFSEIINVLQAPSYYGYCNGGAFVERKERWWEGDSLAI